MPVMLSLSRACLSSRINLQNWLNTTRDTSAGRAPPPGVPGSLAHYYTNGAQIDQKTNECYFEHDDLQTHAKLN